MTTISGSTSLYGSLRGGTKLFLEGSGFDKEDPANNLVFLGDYTCPVISATTTELICETQDSGLTSSSSSLLISVDVG